MSSRPTLKLGIYLTGLAYFYGVLLGGLSLAWQVLFRDGWPSMSWWQWLLAPLGIGCAAMAGELLVQKLQDSTGFGDYGIGKSKRVLHLAVLLVVLAALIIGPAVYKVANP
jgi:uncharacterized membrane protein